MKIKVEERTSGLLLPTDSSPEPSEHEASRSARNAKSSRQTEAAQLSHDVSKTSSETIPNDPTPAELPGTQLLGTQSCLPMPFAMTKGEKGMMALGVTGGENTKGASTPGSKQPT